MATCYFGDGVTSNTDGNWNTVANWYSTPGFFGGCCGCIPIAGTPLGRIPGAGDTVVIAGNGNGSPPVGALPSPITTGPAIGSPFTGAISWMARGIISDGYFTGPVSITNMSPTSGIPNGISGGNWSGTITISGGGGTNSTGYLYGVSGGIFSGTIHIQGTHIADSSSLNAWAQPAITGGTFTGAVTLDRNGNNYVVPGVITGGTYTPAVDMVLNANGTLNPSGFPTDPGFAAAGGTYAPVINLPANVYPATGNVRTGITYGPTGANFTGTFAGGGGDIKWGQVFLGNILG